MADRERATAEIRRAWDRLSDEECALILASYHFKREPTLGERAAESQARATMPDALIARAIGYRESLSAEEVARRLRVVIDPVLERRRGRLLNQLRSLEGEG